MHLAVATLRDVSLGPTRASPAIKDLQHVEVGMKGRSAAINVDDPK
jgi:hypothetical protein